MNRFLVLACIAVALVQQQQPKDKNLGNQSQKDAQSTRDQTDISAAHRAAPNAPDQKTAGNENKGQNQAVNVTVAPEIFADKATDWIIAFCTIVLTGVGIIGTRAAIKTLRQIKRQADTLDDHKVDFDELAKAATNNALAAKESADSLINSERAWIMADLRFQSGSGGIIHSTNPLGERTSAKVELRIRNCGPTPAWVFQQWIRLEVSPKILMSDTPYPSPSRSDRIEGAIGQGASHMSYEILPIAKDDPPIIWQADVFGDGWATEGNRLNTYIYGIVTYRDAFNSLRETYFGYRVDGRRLERIPSDAFNKNT